MSERFELSFKNILVRMLGIIMVPTLITAILLMLLTEIPTVYITVLPLISWLIFFSWRYYYKRRQKKIESIT